MNQLVEYPFLTFVVSLIVLWFSAHVGGFIRNGFPALEESKRHDFEVILGATLTLLALIIGFSFAMVVSRYDQRKNYEEAEANAIGTEYVRTELLPAVDGVRLRKLLEEYTAERILFYETRDAHQLREIEVRTAQLQSELWSMVRTAATKEPTAVVALAVSGMNDVLNSQGYTQAAWWNRLPTGAWVLMAAIAIFCNVMVGYASHRSAAILFLVLPVAVSISFFLIADIDSPRAGHIRVLPENLIALSYSLHTE